MKRSEMIKILVFSHELHAGNDPGWLEFPEAIKAKLKAYEYANRVLQDIEAAGMLPPVIKELENSWLDISSMRGETVEDFHKWEKEDD